MSLLSHLMIMYSPFAGSCTPRIIQRRVCKRIFPAETTSLQTPRGVLLFKKARDATQRSLLLLFIFLMNTKKKQKEQSV